MVAERLAQPLGPGPSIGDHLTIVRTVHDGGLGQVYLVWSSRQWAPFACKTLLPELADEPWAQRALVREGQILRTVAHPRIVRLYELVERPAPYLLLEYLEGPTIVDLCRRAGALPSEAAVRLTMHLAAALLHVHRRGYLHLDVKPGNVLLVNGYPKLIDFSLARRRSAGRPAEVHGTPAYMAPEQCLRKRLTPATDVFGLGCVLHKMLGGRSPFRAGVEDSDAPLELRYPQLLEPAPDLRLVRSDLPPGLAEIVARCLSRAPDTRYEDMAALLYDLAPFAGPGIWPPGLDPDGASQPAIAG
jgi:serine/threonine protein kinase